jgi:CheY-like chemotaxis protein
MSPSRVDAYCCRSYDAGNGSVRLAPPRAADPLDHERDLGRGYVADREARVGPAPADADGAGAWAVVELMPSRPSRVLIVDDDPGVLDVLQEMLGMLGYDVMTAASGEVGLEALPIFEPDVLLLDLWMPGLTGVDVLSGVRHDYPHLPVVVVTANAAPDLTRDAVAQGAFDVISKPFTMADLGRIVDLAIQERRSRAPDNPDDPLT